MADYNLNDVIKLFGQVTKRNGSAVNARDIDMNEDGQISVVEIKKAAKAFGVNLSNFFNDVDPAAIQTDCDGWDRIDLENRSVNLVAGLNKYKDDAFKTISEYKSYVDAQKNLEDDSVSKQFYKDYEKYVNTDKLFREYTEDDFKDCNTLDEWQVKVETIKGKIDEAVSKLKVSYDAIEAANEVKITEIKGLNSTYTIRKGEYHNTAAFEPKFSDNNMHTYTVTSSNNTLCKVSWIDSSSGHTGLDIYPSSTSYMSEVTLTITLDGNKTYTQKITIITEALEPDGTQGKNADELKATFSGTTEYAPVLGSGKSAQGLKLAWSDGKTHEKVTAESSDTSAIEILGARSAEVTFNVIPDTKESNKTVKLTVKADNKVVGTVTIKVNTHIERVTAEKLNGLKNDSKDFAAEVNKYNDNINLMLDKAGNGERLSVVSTYIKSIANLNSKINEFNEFNKALQNVTDTKKSVYDEKNSDFNAKKEEILKLYNDICKYIKSNSENKEFLIEMMSDEKKQAIDDYYKGDSWKNFDAGEIKDIGSYYDICNLYKNLDKGEKADVCKKYGIDANTDLSGGAIGAGKKMCQKIMNACAFSGYGAAQKAYSELNAYIFMSRAKKKLDENGAGSSHAQQVVETGISANYDAISGGVTLADISSVSVLTSQNLSGAAAAGGLSIANTSANQAAISISENFISQKVAENVSLINKLDVNF